MSDTPRTDEEVARQCGSNAQWPNVSASFARQLERELAEARAILHDEICKRHDIEFEFMEVQLEYIKRLEEMIKAHGNASPYTILTEPNKIEKKLDVNSDYVTIGHNKNENKKTSNRDRCMDCKECDG